MARFVNGAHAAFADYIKYLVLAYSRSYKRILLCIQSLGLLKMLRVLVGFGCCTNDQQSLTQVLTVSPVGVAAPLSLDQKRL